MTIPSSSLPATLPTIVLPKPPVELAWLTDIVGADGVLALIEEHGGRRLYIPKKSDDASFLDMLGRECAEKLCRTYGGETYKIPLAKNWRARLYRAKGWTYAEIAKKLGNTEGAVHQILQNARMTNPSRQLSFFS
jgi:Mor family transcriptional regulator